MIIDNPGPVYLHQPGSAAVWPTNLSPQTAWYWIDASHNFYGTCIWNQILVLKLGLLKVVGGWFHFANQWNAHFQWISCTHANIQNTLNSLPRFVWITWGGQTNQRWKGFWVCLFISEKSLDYFLLFYCHWLQYLAFLTTPNALKHTAMIK